MYKTISEWASRNDYARMAAPLARFYEMEGDHVTNQNVWKQADLWMIANRPELGLEFANAAQAFSDWLRNATTFKIT